MQFTCISSLIKFITFKKLNQIPNYEHDWDMTPKCPNFVIRLWELMEFFH